MLSLLDLATKRSPMEKSSLAFDKLRLGLTTLLEGIPVKDAATHFGVEDSFAWFPRVGEAPTAGLLTQLLWG
jgi:hypothetical protein